MTTVMVVVDVQKYFDASHTIADNIAETIKAMKLPLVIVEYDIESFENNSVIPKPQRDTLEAIEEATNEVPQRILVAKNEDDGSHVVLEAMQRWGIAPPYEFLVCGVNTDACVYSTVYGLVRKNYSTKVIANCCASDNTAAHNMHIHDWKTQGMLV